MTNEAYIVDYIRTPIGSLNGSLSNVRTDDLAAIVIKEIVNRNPKINKLKIDDVIMGCANQAGEDNRNVARMSLLLAGLPCEIPGETVNRLCSSGMAAIAHASRSIKTQEADIIIAGGVENMTRAPYVISKSSKPYGRDSQMFDTTFGWRFPNSKIEKIWGVDSMGQTAENLAELKAISRIDQDAFSVLSQSKAMKARDSGRLGKEIVDINIPQYKKESITFKSDEFIKPHTNLEILSKLKPAFKINGTVTAGNSSGLNDGSAATLIMSKRATLKFGYDLNIKILVATCVGVEPRIMGIGPVFATKKVLSMANLTLNDIDIIELNEAFASQSLACIRELGLKDDDPRINLNGGAIALGHPLGVSGTRIVGSAALDLQLTQKKYALCTMCVGVGQGYAIILENQKV